MLSDLERRYRTLMNEAYKTGSLSLAKQAIELGEQLVQEPQIAKILQDINEGGLKILKDAVVTPGMFDKP